MTSITCPHCSRVGSLQKPPRPGQWVRCPGCQERFEVQSVAEPAPSDDGFDSMAIAPPTDQGIDLGIDVGDASQVPAPAPIPAPTPTPQPNPPAVPTTPPVAASASPMRFRPPIPLLALLMNIAAGICFAAAVLIGLNNLGSNGGYSPTAYANRFKDDNSYGASANALEFLARRDEASSPMPWGIAGLLCLVVATVERLRQEVELARRAS